MNKFELSKKIKEEAENLGFSGITFAKAEYMEDESKKLEQWLNQNHHGSMSYMENHFDLRVNPTKLVPGAKTVISLLYNYFNDEVIEQDYKVSMYAYGKDYHKVVKDKLYHLEQSIKNLVGDIASRCFVDSAPILERDWARRSGLGWVGKNTLLINPKKGSYFFLAEIVLDLLLDYDLPIKDYCGTCRRCIDACPTEAISPQGYLMDGSKCISYLTIERKEAIPDEFKDKMEDWIFGCDICQQVCPWNRFSSNHQEDEFLPNSAFKQMKKKDWQDLTQETYQTMFKDSPLKRKKFEGIMQTIKFINRDEKED